MNSSEEAQKAHYNKISDAYAAHYGDKWSQKYRNKFINQSLVKDIERWEASAGGYVVARQLFC